MAQNGIKTFDHTLQQTNFWLKEISESMGDPRRTIAYHALRGVLFAVRDRLTVNEAVQLSAQLPLLIRGVFFEGYRPAGKPEKLLRYEFLARVAGELEQGGGANPEKAIKAVLAVLLSHVDYGEMEDVRNAMPHELRSLWPEQIPA